MQKPKFLYHASTDPGIEVFEPRNETPRYEGEENLVFATPYKAVAAMFLASRSISSEIAKYGDDHVIFINATEEDYKIHDKGGAIYTLPADTFTTDSNLGMKETEWVSKVPVKPLSKVVYLTSLAAMQENNVQIYFVDATTFLKIQSDPSKGLDFL